MTTATLPATSEPHNNVTIAKYLGAPPLIDGEDPEAYQRILEQMTAMVSRTIPSKRSGCATLSI